MKKIFIAAIAGVAVLGTAQVQAQEKRSYIGVGVTTVEHDTHIPGATGGNTDGWKSSGKIFGGVEFDRMWGVEAGYTDYRSFGRNYTIAGVPGRVEMDGYGVYLAGKATAPLTDRFELFGKLGLVHNRMNASGSTMFADDSDTDPYFGVGAQYNLNEKVALTLEYERYGKSRDFGVKPNAWTVGARWNF